MSQETDVRAKNAERDVNDLKPRVAHLEEAITRMTELVNDLIDMIEKIKGKK